MRSRDGRVAASHKGRVVPIACGNGALLGMATDRRRDLAAIARPPVISSAAAPAMVVDSSERARAAIV